MKYKWKYIDKLEPVVKPVQLTLGKIIHQAFDMFYKGFSDSDTLEYIHDAFDEQIAKQEIADQEDLVIAKYTAMGMWRYYPYKNTKEFTKILSEEEAKIPIGNYEMLVKVDGLVQKNNVWWIRELKTTSLNQRQFEQRADVSSQVTGYIYGMKKKGYDVKGVMFDFIKKPLLRKNRSDDMYNFGMRIMKDYKDRPKLYFGRIYSYRSPNDLDLFEKDMIAVADEIEQRKKSGNWYRNQDQCYSFNSECVYKKICFQEKPDPLTIQLYFTQGR